MKEMMFFSEYNYTAPPNWTIENIDDGVCHASGGKDGDAINIMYYEIASGILMLDIDLACAEMPLGVPEALAFMFACAFNVPCVMTLGTTYSETHSLKWTVIIALFYFAMALCISFVAFHVASLLMA